MLPDLIINGEIAAQTLWIRHQLFEGESCELAEQCVNGSGVRRLLNFETRVENWGPGAFNPGPEANSDLFEFSECHGHYHFRGLNDYRLLAADGSVVAAGQKQSFCLADMEPLSPHPRPAPPDTRPGAGPPPSGCNYLSAGFADIYGIGTPCQWIDITDVDEGSYVLQLAINSEHRAEEYSYENNVVSIPVHIPADVPCVEVNEVCGDAVDQDCDEKPDAWDADCSPLRP